jgi:hypothetical protein
VYGNFGIFDTAAITNLGMHAPPTRRAVAVVGAAIVVAFVGIVAPAIPAVLGAASIRAI